MMKILKEVLIFNGHKLKCGMEIICY